MQLSPSGQQTTPGMQVPAQIENSTWQVPLQQVPPLQQMSPSPHSLPVGMQSETQSPLKSQ
jgi:hypothetical protein